MCSVFDVVYVCVDDTDGRLESCTVNPMERISVDVLTMNTLLSFSVVLATFVSLIFNFEML